MKSMRVLQFNLLRTRILLLVCMQQNANEGNFSNATYTASYIFLRK